MSMSWAEFLAIPNGYRVLNNGFDQCVALANLYHQEVIGGGFVGVSSAHQWYTNFDNYATLHDKYVKLGPGENPQVGDIFVSRGGIYNAQHGHIGVCVANWNGSTFGTKEQNAERSRYVYQTYWRSKANMFGYLRPKANVSSIGDKFMRVTWDTTGTAWLVTEDGFYGLSNIQLYNLFVRLINSTPAAPDRFNRQEIDMMNEVLRSLAQSNAGKGGAVDVAAVAKAVNDDAARRLQS